MIANIRNFMYDLLIEVIFNKHTNFMKSKPLFWEVHTFRKNVNEKIKN